MCGRWVGWCVSRWVGWCVGRWVGWCVDRWMGCVWVDGWVGVW